MDKLFKALSIVLPCTLLLATLPEAAFSPLLLSSLLFLAACFLLSEALFLLSKLLICK